VLEKLARDVLVTAVVVAGEFQRNPQHAGGEESHPGGAISLAQLASRGQRA
jgi:hypothetical protein